MTGAHARCLHPRPSQIAAVLLIDCELQHLVARCDEKFIPIVKDHAERDTVWFEDGEVTPFGVKNLDTFYIADKDAAFAVHGDGISGGQLTRLVTGTAESR